MSTMKNDKIKLMTWWFIRAKYEQYHKDFVFPDSLKYLIRDFSSKAFDTTILSLKQDIEFSTLLTNKLPNISNCEIRLLYRASKNEYLASKFHDLCDGHGPTIIIIKNNFKNIFGGYTNIPWGGDGNFHHDKGESFLFGFKDGGGSKIYDLLPTQRERLYEVQHWKGSGPLFGAGNDIKILNKCNDNKYSYCYPSSYNVDNMEMCGGTLEEEDEVDGDCCSFLVEEYEVFEILHE